MTFAANRAVAGQWIWLLAALAAGLLLVVVSPAVAVVAVGGVSALLLIALRPIVGLALALFVATFGAWEAIFVGGVLGRFSSGQLLLALTLVAWLVSGLARQRVRVPRTPLNLPLLLFTLALAVTLWSATSVWDGVKEIGKWLEIALVMWLVVDEADRWRGRDSAENLSPSIRYLRFIVFILLAGAIFQGTLGIWQYAVRGDGPEHFLIADGLYRASGTFQQPNPFGGFMSLMLTVAVGSLLGVTLASWDLVARARSLRAVSSQTWIWLGFLVSSIAVLLGGLLGSWSRGAWINFGVALLVLAFFLPRKRRYGALLVLGAAAMFLLLWQAGAIPATIWERLTGFLADFQLSDVRGVDINDANFAVIERLAHWQSALGMARDSLWLGVGFGNYEAAYPRYALINWPAPLGHAHNLYLNYLAEGGVVGLLAYVGLWLVVIRQTLKALATRSWELRGLALGLLAAWAGMAVHHLLDNLYVNNMFIHIGVLFGVLVLLQRGERSAAPT